MNLLAGFKEFVRIFASTEGDVFVPAWEESGEVLNLLENETGMHSCLEVQTQVAGERRRQEEASP